MLRVAHARAHPANSSWSDASSTVTYLEVLLCQSGKSRAEGAVTEQICHTLVAAAVHQQRAHQAQLWPGQPKFGQSLQEVGGLCPPLPLIAQRKQCNKPQPAGT